MGDFPTLLQTTIFENHPSCAEHEDFICSYLLEEVKARCMSSPFSRDETETMLRGQVKPGGNVVYAWFDHADKLHTANSRL
jgi:hypothetical protein